MKLLIIIAGMLAVTAGAGSAYYNRHLYLQAALYAEGQSLSHVAKAAIAEYYTLHGALPQANDQAGLPPSNTLFGTAVQQIRVVRDGVLVVEFNPDLDHRTMVLTPEIGTARGSLRWRCTSETIPKSILAKLRPRCTYTPETAEGRMMQAIADRNLPAMQSLLDDGAHLETVINGNTPLMLAARIGDPEIAEQLLDAGAAVDHATLTAQRRTPLMVAVTGGKAEVVALLLSRGASPDRRDYSDRSALDYARQRDARKGDAQFELMVAAGHNPLFAGRQSSAVPNDATDKMQRQRLSALHTKLKYAIENCHVKRLVTLLSEQGSYAPTDSVAGQLVTVHTVKPSCITHLQTYLDGKTLWHEALVAAMESAIDSCDLQVAETLLLDYPALDLSVVRTSQSLLTKTVHSGCPDLLTLFLRKRDLLAHLRTDSLVTAIAQVSQESLLKTVSALINAGVSVNAKAIDGRTPLATAIAYEQPVVAKYLLEAGANVGVRTANGSWPLIEAAKRGYVHLLADLLENGANVAVTDSLGRSALHAAVAKGQKRSVELLLLAGANPRLQDHNGVDAVVMAESYSRGSIRSALLQD